MPYGHAESNDLLRNRERSSDNGAYKVRPQVTHTAPPLREREKLRNGVMVFSKVSKY